MNPNMVFAKAISGIILNDALNMKDYLEKIHQLHSMII
jgi:hypothetical protein